MLLDSNILIYASKPGGEQLRAWLANPHACVSIISRVETLGYHRLEAGEKVAIEGALQELPELAFGREVAARAITLRQQRKIGLADSIIAGTALHHDLPLVTRNADDFKDIPDLRVINPFVSE